MEIREGLLCVIGVVLVSVLTRFLNRVPRRLQELGEQRLRLLAPAMTCPMCGASADGGALQCQACGESLSVRTAGERPPSRRILLRLLACQVAGVGIFLLSVGLFLSRGTPTMCLAGIVLLAFAMALLTVNPRKAVP